MFLHFISKSIKHSICYSLLFTFLFVYSLCVLTCKRSEKEIVSISFNNLNAEYINAIKAILTHDREKSPEISFLFEKEIASEDEAVKSKNESASMTECFLFSTDFSKGRDEFSLPLLVEPFYLLANKKMLDKHSFSLIQTEDDFLALLKTCNMDFPILLSGSDSETLLFFLSATMFMMGNNSEIVLQNITDVYNWKNNSVFNRVIEWQTKGFFHPEWFRLTNIDVEVFMESEDVAFVFIKNSDLAKMPQEVQDLYSVVNLPSANQQESKRQFAKVISLFSQKDGKLEKIDRHSSTIKKVLNLFSDTEENEIDELLKKEGMLRMSEFEKEKHIHPHNLVSYKIFANAEDTAMLDEVRQYFHVGGLGY